MKRLPDFEHNVIGRINHIIDWPDSVASQAVFNPHRRTCNGDIFQEASAKTLAVFGITDMNGSAASNRETRFPDCDFPQSDLAVENCTNFKRHTYHTEAVGSVGSQFHFINNVIQVK